MHGKLDRWFCSHLGKAILSVECEGVRKLLSRLYGYHILQVGGVTTHAFLGLSPIQKRFFLGARSVSEVPVQHVYGEAEELPFASASMDVVLLPHTLEVLGDERSVLQEVERVLMPGGHAVVLGFNPYSLWGLRYALGSRHLPPWTERFRGVRSLQRCCNPLGLIMVRCKTFFFRPPCQEPALLDQWMFLESVGQLCWPYCGGVYVAVFKKSLEVVTPIALKSGLCKRSVLDAPVSS